MISSSRLRELLQYDPKTGIFTWLICHKSKSYLIGSRAGSTQIAGYRMIVIEGNRCYEHRLAWLYMTGEWPKEIDHRDGNKSNNSWENLRVASRSMNMANAMKRKDNTSGSKGVYLDRRDGRWSAYLTLNQKRIALGRFATKEEAEVAYTINATRLFGEFARTS